MKDTDLFDSLLIDFQPDLKKIIGKFRRQGHLLDPDEILSEINAYLLKKKEDIINYRDEENGVVKFTEIGFKKAAYAYCKNLVGWQHSRVAKSKYVSKRLDITHETEDGTKTSFEFFCEKEGKEDEGFAFDDGSKFKYIYKLLTIYDDSLSENEKKILEMMKSGKRQEDIAEELGVTHQAISHAYLNLVEKIKQKINFNINDETPEKIEKGIQSLNSLFKKKRTILSSKYRKDLISFISNAYKKYTLEEVSRIFKNGVFSENQICGVLNTSGFGDFIIKKNYREYSYEEELKLIEMCKKKFSRNRMAKELNKSPMSISAKCGHLKKINKIKKAPWHS